MDRIFIVDLKKKRYIHIIGLLGFLTVFVRCGGRDDCMGNHQKMMANEIYAELLDIDSLMWKHSDSAFKSLLEFSASLEVDSLDVFDGHYYQLLVSELLYKNDYEQNNREPLMRAVDYFDSLNNQGQCFFLDARAHYMEGVVLYEQGCVVSACESYLKALELMEGGFEEKDLTGTKAQFMAFLYNRLGDLFSEQYMMEKAIVCYEQALVYCLIEPTSPQGVSNIFYHLGKQYDKLGKKEIANRYYEQALEKICDDKTRLYRSVVVMKSLCDYQLGKGMEQALNSMRQTYQYADGVNEQLNYYLTIGGVFYEEKWFDSALFYLEPVFILDKDLISKTIAAEYLRVIYDSLEYKEKLSDCIQFLADHKKMEGENKSLVSSLDDLFKTYQFKKHEKIKVQEKRNAIFRTGIFGLFIVVILVIVIVVVIKHGHQLEKQRMMPSLSNNDHIISFMEEPVCQKIKEEVRYLRITTRDSYCHHKTDFDDNSFKDLGEAVERHYHGFDEELLRRYQDMKPDDFLLCYLYLLNLNEKQIAVIRKCGYSAIKKQSERLMKRMGINIKIEEFVKGIATKLGDQGN